MNSLQGSKIAVPHLVIHAHTQTFLSSLCEVPDFHESLQLEEYVALCRNDICIDIAVSEIGLLHQLLLKYRPCIVSKCGF